MPDCDTMDEAVAMMHEMYVTAQRQGFDKHEAMHLLMGDPCCKREDRDQ